MNSKDRLLEFLKYLGIGQTAFEEKVGFARGYISKVKKAIGSEMMFKIASVYPELNVNWLITGEGEMLKENNINTNSMKNGVVKRIVEIINYENMSIVDLSDKLDMPLSVTKSMLYSELDPSYKQIKKIIDAFPAIAPEWLLTGEGEMLRASSAIPHLENVSKGIPHIESVEAYCGPGQGFDVTVMRKECPMYNIPGMKGVEFTISAAGRSMINREHPDRSIKDSDYIGCIRCRSGAIRYGEVYALSTSEGVMVKIVQESDREGFVLLESFNREEGFKPFYYPVVDIHDMALVVAVASISRWA